MSDNNKSTKLDITSSLAEKGVDVIKGFIDKACGPFVEEIGGMAGDWARLWRLRVQVKVVQKAEEYIVKKGITTKQISLKTLVPLLESASLEDDETLQDKWANLLVNYLDSSENLKSSIFPFMLSQLSSNEVKALDKMILLKKPQPEEVLKSEYRLNIAEIENLNRLSIIQRFNNYSGNQSTILSQYTQNIKISQNGNPTYELTEIGLLFVRACRLEK